MLFNICQQVGPVGIAILILSKSGDALRKMGRTYRSGAMKHAHAEIPEEKTAIVADTAKSVRPLVASPRVERYRGYPRVMALTPRDNLSFWKRPDRHEVVLSARHDVFAVG